MIQQMLEIWSLVPLPFLNPAWTFGSSWFMYCWSLAWRNFEHYFISVWEECNCVVVWAFLGIVVLWDQKSEINVLVGPCNLFLKPIGESFLVSSCLWIGFWQSLVFLSLELHSSNLWLHHYWHLCTCLCVFTQMSPYKATDHNGLMTHLTPMWLHLNQLHWQWPYFQRRHILWY